MYLRFISTCALLVALTSGLGCSGRTYVTLDADVNDAAHPPDGMLVLLSAPSLAIRPGEVARIDVRCVGPSGAPHADVEVTFAIEGAALDSTLSALSMRTDADGRASGGIVAGTQATSFRVRVVSRAASLPIYVDVGVGTSFGTLVVRAPYGGSRIVTHRIVDVVPRALCADLASSPPEVGARALPDGADELSIAGLPTTVHYAVLARAQSDVALTASGCVDDVVLAPDGTTQIDVPFVDTPLSIDGRYVADLTLDASSATDSALELVAHTVEAATEARGGDPHAMLDALETELTVRVSPTAGAAFGEARTIDLLERALLERLTADSSAPTVLTVRWIGAARTAMAHVRIDATLVVATPGASVITTDQVTMSDAADGTLSFVPASLDAALGVPRSLVVLADGTRDSVELDNLIVDAPIGAMLLAWLDAVAESDGLSGAPGLLAPACGTLRAFALEVPAAAECDVACVDAACEAVIAAELADLRTAASLLDLSAGALSLSGPLAASDDDGDARVDALSGTLTGSYLDGASATFGPVGGAIEVARAPAAP